MKSILICILLLSMICFGHAQQNGQWQILHKGGSFRAIDFVNDQVGWIAGQKSLMKTVDGGKTWKYIDLDVELGGFDFVNESVGWAVDHSHHDHKHFLYKTNDGGQTWIVQKEYVNPDAVYDFSVVNDNVVYTIEEAHNIEYEGDWMWSVEKSTDGGLSWDRMWYVNSGLPSNIVEYVTTDVHGNIWCTDRRDLAMFNGDKWTVYTEFNSVLPGCFINSMTTDQNGNIWMGTSDSGLVMFDGDNWIVYNVNNSELPVNDVGSIAIDSNGNKWIVANGLVMFDGINWQVYNESNSGLPDNNVRGIAIDNSDNKWIITWDEWSTSGGLVKYDGINWTVYDFANSGFTFYHLNCITVDKSNNVWIGIDEGLAMFDGNDWELYNESNSGLPSNSVTAIAIDDSDNKWIGTLDSGLVMFDGGNWHVYNESNSGLPRDQVFTIAIDNSNNKWIGTFFGGLAKFDGKTWNVYQDDYYEKRAIDFYNQDIGIVSGICSGKFFVLRTTDGGNNWVELDLPEFNAIQFVNHSIAYFLGETYNVSTNTRYYSLYKSTDTLSNWTELIKTTNSITSFYCLDENTIFMLMQDDTLGGIIKSSDGGLTWERINENWYGGDIYFSSSDVGFIVDGSKVFRSTDGGNNWFIFDMYYPFQDVFFLDRMKGFACGGWAEFGSHGDLLITLDGGITWNENFELGGWADGYIFKNLYFLNDKAGFLLTDNNIFRTIDSGQSWSEIYDNENDLISYEFAKNDMCFKDEQIGWIVGSDTWAEDSSGAVIYETKDGGDNWELAWKDENTELDQLSLHSIHFVNNNGWAVGDNGLFLKYSEQDQWQPVTGVTDFSLYKVLFSDVDHGWIFGGNIYNDNDDYYNEYLKEDNLEFIFLKTIDGGSSWEEISNFKYVIKDMIFEDNLHGYAVGMDTSYHGMILKTVDGGNSWQIQVEDLNAPLTAIHFTDSVGWAVGDNGLILRTDNWTTWINAQTGEKYPSKYHLYQNYPNPFNPSTTIEFTLPKSEFITLKIFNTLGQKVATLVSKKLNQGNHTYTFDGSNLASGIYYYQLVAGEYREVKKMILLR